DAVLQSTTLGVTVGPLQGNGHSLTAIASGPVTIPGGTGLANLSVAGGGVVVMSGTTTASGKIDASGALMLNLAGDMYASAGTVTFPPIMGSNHTLMVTASGMTTFHAAAGLANLCVAGGGLAVLSGGTLLGTGNLNFSS